jgi:FMN phosphatase YigB (HAD superfamily)
MDIKYILFDVADTLLYKKNLILSIYDILTNNNMIVSIDELKHTHRKLFDSSVFPDKTNKDFYIDFNSRLLTNLNLPVTNLMPDEIYKTCSKLDWEAFDDSSFLKKINLPIGIASNFSKDLRSIIKNKFGEIFSHIFISEEMGISKPNTEFYSYIINKLNINPENLLMIGDSIKLDGNPSKLEGINFLLIDRDNYYSDYTPKIKSLFELKNYIKTNEK